MNRTEILAFRAAHNLSVEGFDVKRDPKDAAARKRAQDANRAAHAQLQRDIRAKRGSKTRGA